MQINGFNSIGEYEGACLRSGFKTARIPLSHSACECFLLITGGKKTSSSVGAWRVFSADESAMLLDGIISSDDMLIRGAELGLSPDKNFLDKLTAGGFSFVNPGDSDKYRRGIYV